MLHAPLHADEMTQQQMLTIWMQKGQHVLYECKSIQAKVKQFRMAVRATH